MSNRSGTANLPGEPSPALIAALKKLLTPLVRLLIARGLTHPFLSNLLKSVFVEVAEREFSIGGKRATDSRIRLITGVHRKDVQKLRDDDYDEDAALPEIVSTGTQLIARWISERPYIDNQGQPRALPLRRRQGQEVSFDVLVADISRQDLRPKVVLEELLQLGIVEVDDSKYVHLKVEAFVPETGFDEKAFYLGRNVRDHIAASVHNLLNRQPPFLDRSVSYRGLAEEDIAQIQARAEQLGMQTLKDLNQMAARLKRNRKPDADNDQRFNLGMYFYSEHGPDSGEQS